MDEKQWLASTDPRAMILALTGRERMPGCVRLGKASERKLRLLACACLRRDVALWRDGQSRELALADIAAFEMRADGVPAFAFSILSESGRLLDGDAAEAAVRLSGYADDMGGTSESAPRAELVRCVFGNPWKPAWRCGCDPDVGAAPCEWRHELGGWLRWGDGLVKTMARAIYDDRTFDQLPILADALEEAGCASKRILAHCRQGKQHARGCWVVDLILGKK